jgi:Ca2+-binding EF-hand superfamily protein
LRRFDKDNDGKLSARELAGIPAAANTDLRALIARFDKDKDGQLNAAEIAEAIAALRAR